MTAISAIRATESHDTANPFPACTRVVIPGTERTYENREILREMGPRWDPPTHAWHGIPSARERDLLRERFHLAVRPVVPLEAFPASPTVPDLPTPPHSPSPAIRAPVVSHPRVGDGSRTRAEAGFAFRDSDERVVARHLAGLRGRVKHARAVIETTPGLAEILTRDWHRAAMFYARCGVTAERVWRGVPVGIEKNSEPAP
jgi:hypothetical protein